jgi:hypothetical protein
MVQAQPTGAQNVAGEAPMAAASLIRWSGLVKWGALGALLAAIAWTVSGIIAFVLVHPPASNMGPMGSLSWYLIESSDAIAEVGMMVAVVGLHARQTPNYGRLGTAGSIVAFVGTALAFLSTVLWLLTHNGNGIVGLLFMGGLLAWLVGFPILGVATLRAGVLPRWCGLLLVAWLVYLPLVLFLLTFHGEARVLFGLMWLALGYALWSQRSTAVQRSSRVS